MTSAVTAAAVLKLLPGRPRLLALGEPTHGPQALLDLRNDLFRQLVEEEGYRTITVESDCLMGLIVDDYVTGGAGELDDVLARGFSHGWGAFDGNRELVRWMRAHNAGRPPAAQVRFAGFDGPLEMTGAASPRAALTALHGYLDADLLPCTPEELDRLLGPDDRWTNPGALMDPAQSIGRTPEAEQLRLLADDLVAQLDIQTPQLIAATSREHWHRARLQARTAVGLLRYHYWLADTSPSRLTRLCALRDLMMAANLLAVADRGPALAHAHNSHLQRTKSSMRLGEHNLEWWSAGAIVDAHLGKDYAFLATAVGTIRDQGIDAPPPNTIEGMLYAHTEDRRLIDPQTAFTNADPVARASTWFGYAAFDPAQLTSIDALVFVRDAPLSGQ